MNWDDLRTILEISRAGSLSAAGSALGVAHTTVGRRLRAAESQLSTRLFDRGPTGLTPTAAGEELIAAAKQMEEAALLARSRVVGHDTRLRGSLRVSTVDFLWAALIEPVQRFVEQYPHIELTLAASRRDVSLGRGEADVVLRLSNRPPEHLVGRRVARLTFAPYAHESLIEEVGADAPLEAYPWIGIDEALQAPTMDAWMQRHAPGARITLRTDGNALLLRRVVLAGVGVHLLPCFDGDRCPTLRRVGAPDPDFARDLWVLTLPALRQTARVRAFMDHIVESIRALTAER